MFGILEFYIKERKAYPLACGFELEKHAHAFAALLNKVERHVDAVRARKVEYVVHSRPPATVVAARAGTFHLPEDYVPAVDRIRLQDLQTFFLEEYLPERRRLDEQAARSEARLFADALDMLMTRSACPCFSKRPSRRCTPAAAAAANDSVKKAKSAKRIEACECPRDLPVVFEETPALLVPMVTQSASLMEPDAAAAAAEKEKEESENKE